MGVILAFHFGASLPGGGVVEQVFEIVEAVQNRIGDIQVLWRGVTALR
jgi:hypothetical protein